jgi:hypothetical protein
MDTLSATAVIVLLRLARNCTNLEPGENQVVHRAARPELLSPTVIVRPATNYAAVLAALRAATRARQPASIFGRQSYIGFMPFPVDRYVTAQQLPKSECRFGPAQSAGCAAPRK